MNNIACKVGAPTPCSKGLLLAHTCHHPTPNEASEMLAPKNAPEHDPQYVRRVRRVDVDIRELYKGSIHEEQVLS